MEIGVNVWVRDTVSTEAWISGTIVDKAIDGSETVISVNCDSGASIVNFRLKSEHDDLSDLKLRNAADDEHADNLIKLPFLNEPAILHCLQERYKSGLIYTYTGPILIAVNPFKRVNLYTKSILDEYYNKGLMKSMGADVGTELSPHVYAIADNAYRQMMGAIVRGVDKSGTEVKCNQSILISGESGAGKTESTKVVLSYLTTVGRGLDSGDSLQGSIMEKILQSNPILEAFGNAKTKRNDNSSRFGKFIQLNFNRRGNLIGGSIKTYLLEKVRLPLQQSGERNFHIFYQLVSGSTEEEKLRRGLRRLEEFNYTSKSGVFQLTNVNDGEEYESLCGALHTLNFDPEDQILMFDIVAGILHLGQLWFQSFTDGEGEGSVLDPNPENEKAMALCTTLLGLSKEQLLESLTVKQIVAAGETYYKKLTKVQAADARDALSKAMYGKMFDWIVKTINIRIEVEASNIRANIGVLDIFGFESFAINSFEQLCINYANEALQQQFNQFIFKLEQTEYEKEKIEWSFIHFPDNKDCLDLIEHRINGLIAMLDDECRLPKASDEKFAARMYKDYATNPRFGATAPQKRSGKFSINHYAGMVEYTVATFVEKNKDELPKEANSLLQSSSNRLLGSLFRPDVVSAIVDPDLTVLPPGKRKSVGVSERKAQPSAAVLSVGSQFKDQLGALMTTIYSTSPHYIRCLKPNDQNVADNFTRLRITEQLRYGGVLEAVRVARSGFPVRLAHEEFYRRYKMLVHARLPEAPTCYKSYCGDFVSAINTIVSSTERQSKLERYSFDFRGSIGMDGFQVGLTKLFLRKECHDFLETSRYRCVHFGAVQLQSFYRSCRYRSWFKNAKYAVRLIQRMYRGSVARRIAQNIRHTKAALTIQSLVRCYITRKRFTNFLFAVTILQSHARRRILSRAFEQIRRERAAKKIAKNLRMVVQRRSYWKLRRAIVKLQGKQRIVHAKHLLRKLRTEAKDLGKLQENNETLKREIEELKARAAEERVRMEQEFVRKAQENLLASNKAELEQFKTRVVELEELLRTEAKLREEAETRVQVLPPPPPEPSPALCYKCRSKIDEDGSPHSPAPHEVPPHRRNSRRSSAGDMRASLPPLGDIHSPVRAQNGVAALTPAKMAHLEDYKQANELLQAEVSRLRGTNIEHLSAIENLKRELQRAKEDEDRLRVELAKKRPLDHIAARQRRGSARFMKDATERPGAPLTAAPEPKSEIVELPVPAPTSSWISNWDAEDDDTSESGSVQDGQSLAASSGSLNNVASHASIASVETAALQSVEKNLEKWKMELVKGVKAILWEGQKVTQADVTVKLDTAGTCIQFLNVQQRRAFGLFNNRIDVLPLKLAEITECLPGAELKTEAEPNLLLTIIAKESSGTRVVVLKFASRDERNVMLSKIRAIVAASSVNLSSSGSALTPAAKSEIRAALTAAPTATSSATPFESSNPLYLQRVARRPSVRETMIHKSLNSSTVQSTEVPASVAVAPEPLKAADDGVSTMTVRALQKSLQEEKEVVQKTKLQMVFMNNDLAEKDEQITSLKKNLQEFELKLKEKDNLMKQDTMVRLQLGKRLEQILIDKEEALEQLEQLRAQLDMITSRS